LLKARDKYFWIVAVLVPLVVAGLFALVLGAQLGSDPCTTTEEHTRAGVEHSYLLVLTIMACFFGALSSSLEILRERAVLARERRSGLGLLPYLASKAWLFVIPALTHPLASLSVLHLAGGALEGELVRHYLVLVPGFFAAACAGLCISAAVGSAEGVIGLSVSYAIIQTVFSVFAPLSITVGQDAHHEFLRWAAAPITARWTLSGLVSQSDLCRPWADEGKEDEVPAQGPKEPARTVATERRPTELKPDLPAGELTAASGSQSSDPKHAPLLPELNLPANPPQDPPLGARAEASMLPSGGPSQCKPQDPCQPDVCMKDQFFSERCRKNYYLDHGISDAEKSSERTDPLHLVSSVGMNSLLALVALVGAGLLLRRKNP
jgi:hypothetical protein